MLRLYDTASGKVRPLPQRVPGQVSLYNCGPTVYGPPHLGHGRFALTFDVLRRYLEWTGLEVVHVSNVTDIDDKIIARAAQEGTDAADVARHWEAVWWEAMDAIGVLRPTHDPHATAYLEPMIELIGGLVERGVAYETSDGVYFRAERVADYGLLAHQSLDSLRAGARVEVDEEKESPIDFALWKRAKPGEPAWPSPWGDGRPGWHTECVVMSLDLLGDGFDLHGGGQDLRFPHHENERAQAVAADHVFARHWMHHGWVEVEGEKMSKSLGNYVDLLDLVTSADPRAYRLLVLRSHYRSPFEVNPATTADAAAALGRLDAFARRVADLAKVEPDAEVVDAFRAAMDDDLDTPAAMAVVFDAVRRANALLDAGDEVAAAPLAAAVAELCGAVGLRLEAADRDVPSDIAALVDQREAARTAKDYAVADRLREQLTAAGWTVEDTPGGPVVRRS